MPEYHVDESGPDHQKSFRASVRIGSQTYGEGEGRSKKEAEQQAAEAAWTAISAGLAAASGEAREPGTAARAAGGAGTENGGRPAAGGSAGRGRPSRARTGDRPEGSRSGTASPCPSFPRSRPSAADWNEHVAGPGHRRGRGPAPAGRPAARGRGRGLRGRAARPPGLAAPLRRGKYLWLPADDDALLAHLGMSGQLRGRRARPRAVPARAGPVHLPRRRSRPALHRPAHVRPPAAQPRRRAAAFGHRAHRPRSAGGRLRPGRLRRPAALAAQRHQAGAARPEPGQRGRQHLRRRGAVAGPAALGQGRRPAARART